MFTHFIVFLTRFINTFVPLLDKMQRLKYLILIVVLGFFAVFLNETQNDLPIKQNTKHELKISDAFNTLAIPTSNSFQEFAGFSKQKELTNNNPKFLSKISISKSAFNTDLQYLKTCDFFDLNLTTRTIIYPFHSFL